MKPHAQRLQYNQHLLKATSDVATESTTASDSRFPALNFPLCGHSEDHIKVVFAGLLAGWAQSPPLVLDELVDGWAYVQEHW